MNGVGARLAIAIVLQLGALALLLLVVAGRPWPAPRAAASVVLLTDRSTSIDGATLDRARAGVLDGLRSAPIPVEPLEIEFAGRAGSPRPAMASTASPTAGRLEDLEPLATDLATPLLAALSAPAQKLPAAIIVLSDGHATRGDTRRALEGAAAAGVPVLWQAVAPGIETPRIVEVQAPADAPARDAIPVVVRLGGSSPQPVQITVTARDRATTPVIASHGAGRLGSAKLNLAASAPGTLLLDVELSDATTGRLLDVRTAAAVIDVQPPAGLLYVARSPRPFATSLRAGGWIVASVGPEALDGLAGALDKYDAVMLDDVAATSARASTWDALAKAVRDRGTGLLVLGGDHSFAAGGYRDSRLESVLPVLSRPGALGEAAAVAFVVDKSGSMGASAAGVDRFSLAQRAVVETAATLTGRDSAGVIVFDVEPREIIAQQPASEFQRAVAAPWPARPRGGTRLAAALELAARQLEAAPAGRRFLVLVTDGFVVDADDAQVRARLARAGIETIALAVGPDADLGMLGRLVEPGRGIVLRVGEAAELPALMRDSLETRRAPIERGRIDVHERQPLPFAVAADAGWPAVAAYAVTSPRPDAAVHLESARGDPILASLQAGLGRVVVLTAGLGAWATDWLQWARWPTLAGGLAAWVSRDVAQAGLQVNVTDDASRIQVDVDAADDAAWASPDTTSLRVRTPSGRDDVWPLVDSAPGRMSATLSEPEAGVYTLSVVTPQGMRQLRHLHRAPVEVGPLEPSREITDWQAAGLVRAWSEAELRRTLSAMPAPESVPALALLLALVLFLLGIAVERYPRR